MVSSTGGTFSGNKDGAINAQHSKKLEAHLYPDKANFTVRQNVSHEHDRKVGSG